MHSSEIEIRLWRPARPVELTYTVKGYGVLMGYAVKESSGSAVAEVDIINGVDTKGLVIIPVTLGAGMSAEMWYGPQGLEMSVGILANVASGSVTGSLWIADHEGSNR